jgi:D-glycero-D-manno-heptose 1,7-bisphosphate phosphatase
MTEMLRKAVFLDRDGVLNEDVHLITTPGQLRVLDGVPQALSALKDAGFQLIVISNQPVVARGLIDMGGVARLNQALEAMIQDAGGPALDGFYFCPHHPHADVEEFRMECDCRKPKPGMIERACADHGLDASQGFMVGDRITDIAAGRNAGCLTIQAATGRENDAPIEGATAADLAVRPDHVCSGLPEAVRWILAL